MPNFSLNKIKNEGQNINNVRRLSNSSSKNVWNNKSDQSDSKLLRKRSRWSWPLNSSINRRSIKKNNKRSVKGYSDTGIEDKIFICKPEKFVPKIWQKYRDGRPSIKKQLRSGLIIDVIWKKLVKRCNIFLWQLEKKTSSSFFRHNRINVIKILKI